MARLDCWCLFWMAVCWTGVQFVFAVSGDVTKKCDGDKAMTLSFAGSPTLFLQKTSGGVVNVINNLPGIVLRVIAGRTTLTVPFNSPYGYASDKGSQYVVTIAVGSRSNLKTFTCLKPARRSVSVAERCAVAATEKFPCGESSSITQADCEANNCCYDSSSSTSPCYFANDGEWLGVSEQRWQLVDSSSPSCSPVTSQSSFVMYQFPVSACGSTVQLAGGNVTYQNTMSAAITVRTGPEGSITRDSVYK
ncbi:ZP1 protein, partial [Polypterus senegalus]|nr:ZP1 protein [Polypterus senegalus]